MAALRLGQAGARWLPRPLMQVLLWPVAAYFAWKSRQARQGSLQFLRRVRGTPEGRRALPEEPGLRQAVQHLHAFAMSLYDRVLVWSGGLERFRVEHDGSHRIFELAQAGRGALLLGAHIGSLDMLAFLSRKYELVVNVVVFYQNARRVNDFLESLADGPRVRLIELDPDSVSSAFRVRACIERGEFVVVMADRMAPGKAARSGETSFLGRPARFPLGPFLLAGVLRCPVRFAICVCTGPGRYTTVLRSLAEGEPVPRLEREKQAHQLMERYVALVEHWCLRHPFQWFNFYDFWEEEPGR